MKILRYTPLLCLVACPGPDQTAAETVATVNRCEITEKSFRQALRAIGTHGRLIGEQPELRDRFLNHLVDTELRAQAAQALGLHEKEEFRQRMGQARTQILATLYLENYLSEKTAETTLQKFFEAEKELFIRKSVRVSHVFFRDAGPADSLSKEVFYSPGKFDAIVKKHLPPPEQSSIRPDWLEKGSHPTGIEKAAFTIKKGAVSPVIRTPSGYHMIRVEDIRYHQNQNFSYLKPDVRRFLHRSLQEELSEELKGKARISIRKKALENFRM